MPPTARAVHWTGVPAGTGKVRSAVTPVTASGRTDFTEYGPLPRHASNALTESILRVHTCTTYVPALAGIHVQLLDALQS